MWITALVEPPRANTAAIALLKEAVTQNIPRLQVFPHHFNDAPTRAVGHLGMVGIHRRYRARAGSEKPRTSAMLVMVEAVPIVMQVPAERAMPSSICAQAFQIDISRAPFRPVFRHIRPTAQDFTVPIAPKHRACRNIDRRQIHADGAHQKRRCRLVATPISTQPSRDRSATIPLSPYATGCDTSSWSASEKFRRACERRHLHRKSAGLPHALF